MILYHGVRNLAPAYSGECKLSYSAGVMVMSAHHPQDILYRSAQPVLTPELPQERRGMIADVVFPTGIDRREDLGSSDRYDIYYGMADTRIGVARLDVPAVLPAGATADAPDTGFSG